jgi:hypothetical protein
LGRPEIGELENKEKKMLWEERQKLTLRINDFSFWQWEVVPQGVVFCLSPQASGTAR